MKAYIISLAASLLGVRSPAPPAIALIGLLGILLGEQVGPMARRIVGGHITTPAMAPADTSEATGRAIPIPDRRPDDATPKGTR